MRINVYTEELIDLEEYNLDKDPIPVEIVTAEYISSRTGLPMKNYGLRIYLKSAPELHYVKHPDGKVRDDDRSAITFWLGPKEKKIFEWINQVSQLAYCTTMATWHDKTEKQQEEAEASEQRTVPRYPTP